MKRQGASIKGIERRIRDAGFEHVTDLRLAKRVKVPLPVLLVAMVVGLVTRARSLRGLEARTAQLVSKHEGWRGLTKRIADNTFSRVLRRLGQAEVLACLHRLIKAEATRGNLKPTRLGIGAAAIDGKNVATVRWRDLCRELALDSDNATAAQVKKRLRRRFPEAQFCQPEGGMPYALMRVHTVTLISSEAAVCIHQQPIAGDTNEIGALPRLLKALKRAYGRTVLVRMITTDAGNTSLRTATMAHKLFGAYFSQIKSIHGELHAEAKRELGRRRPSGAESTYSDSQNGQLVTYRVWRYDLGPEGWMGWGHARQLIRVQRVAQAPTTGKKSVGNRYYVTSQSPQQLNAEQALYVSRSHWRCENETHWTADAELREDRRQLAFSRHPHGVLVASLLKMIALAILAVARRLSRVGYSEETPSWAAVSEHFTLLLCGTILLTEAFDDV